MNDFQNTLYYGDNLKILREYVADQSIDLIYLDPPFNSNRNYNVLFKDETGQDSESQLTAFEDTWHWDQEAEKTYHALVTTASPQIATMLGALRELIGANPMLAYLVMMTARLIELRRVLKDTGSLYLHCDPTASHYLKLVLDTIFGIRNFRNEITWLRSRNPKGSQHEAKRYSPDTDILLFYAKTETAKLYSDRLKIPLSKEALALKYDRQDEKGRFTDGPIIRSPSMGDRPHLVYEYNGYTPGDFGWRVTIEKLREIDKQGNLGWTSHGQPYRKLRPEDDTGHPIGNCWMDISSINPQAEERLGYPTQKPIALLERIIQASSNEGDLVLDPFCGCGTAIHAAHRLKRKWIGIDLTHLAIALQKYRLKSKLGLEEKRDYRIIGEPEDLAAAAQLAQDDRYQFQWWALSLIQAQPLGGEPGRKQGKKGKDKGIDGVITFLDDPKQKPKKVIVQVKSGRVKSSDIRELIGTVNNAPAAIGVFITLENATKEMQHAAMSAGFYHSPNWHKDYAKIQILTIKDLLAGATVQMPPTATTYKNGQREQPIIEQGTLI